MATVSRTFAEGADSPALWLLDSWPTTSGGRPWCKTVRAVKRSKRDGKPVPTYHQGENWVEQPGAHHVLTENTSRTKAAKLRVVFVSNTGDKLKVNDTRS